MSDVKIPQRGDSIQRIGKEARQHRSIEQQRQEEILFIIVEIIIVNKINKINDNNNKINNIISKNIYLNVV